MRKSFQHPRATNVTLQTTMAMGINERLAVIWAIRVPADKEKESKREQHRFMLQEPEVAPC